MSKLITFKSEIGGLETINLDHVVFAQYLPEEKVLYVLMNHKYQELVPKRYNSKGKVIETQIKEAHIERYITDKKVMEQFYKMSEPLEVKENEIVEIINNEVIVTEVEETQVEETNE